MSGNSILHQAIRYGAVGVIVVIGDYLVFSAVLFSAPAAYLLANLAGKAAGALLGFVLHRNFTFRGQHRYGPRRQFASWCAVLLGNMAVSTLLLWLLVEQAGANAFLARVAVDALVILTTFVVSRLWVYRAA